MCKLLLILTEKSNRVWVAKRYVFTGQRGRARCMRLLHSPLHRKSVPAFSKAFLMSVDRLDSANCFLLLKYSRLSPIVSGCLVSWCRFSLHGLQMLSLINNDVSIPSWMTHWPMRTPPENVFNQTLPTESVCLKRFWINQINSREGQPEVFRGPAHNLTCQNLFSI